MAINFDIQFEIKASGYEFVSGSLSSLEELSYLTPEVAKTVRRMSEEELTQLFSSLDAPERALAEAIVNGRYHDGINQSDMSDWLRDYQAVDDHLSTVKLSDVRDFDLRAEHLLSIGIRTRHSAKQFLDLFCHVATRGLDWDDPYQVNQTKVAQMATCPQLAQLPVWALRRLAWVYQFEVHSRMASPETLIRAAKAWRWCPDLDQRTAVRVGAMSIKARILAPIARERGGLGFWEELQALLKLNGLNLIQAVLGGPSFYEWEKVNAIRYLTGVSLFVDTLGDFGAVIEQLRIGCAPSQFCQWAFGSAGKATVEAVAKMPAANFRWLFELGIKDPNLIRQFGLVDSLAYANEAVALLQSLDPKVALRMLGVKTYRHRGEEVALPHDIVQDVGRLWNEFHDKPNLGRVRCWFTLHEELSRLLSKEQDVGYSLNPPPSLVQVDGLSSVDKTWELEVPKLSSTLKAWGVQLNICVGGYANDVARGHTAVVGVRLYGRIAYCVEIFQRQVKQFRGDRNCDPPSALMASVTEALRAAGLVD